MSDQGIEEKDLGAQDSTVSAGDKPADTRIAPGVTEQDHTENKAGDVSVAQPKKRQLTSRTIGAIAACAIALVAVLAGVGYATGLFGSAQSSEQVTHQQAQEQSASVTSSSAKSPRPVSPKTLRMVGTRRLPRKTGKPRTKTRPLIHPSRKRMTPQPNRLLIQMLLPAQQRLTHPKTLVPPLPLVLRLRTRSLNPSPPLHRRPARFPFTSASIARARKAMAWEASLIAPRSCSLKAPRCTTPCARLVLPFPAHPIM